VTAKEGGRGREEPQEDEGFFKHRKGKWGERGNRGEEKRGGSFYIRFLKLRKRKKKRRRGKKRRGKQNGDHRVDLTTAPFLPPLLRLNQALGRACPLPVSHPRQGRARLEGAWVLPLRGRGEGLIFVCSLLLVFAARERLEGDMRQERGGEERDTRKPRDWLGALILSPWCGYLIATRRGKNLGGGAQEEKSKGRGGG